jgi:hypothetical protein
MLTAWVEVISLAAERERPRAHTAGFSPVPRKLSNTPTDVLSANQKLSTDHAGHVGTGTHTL